MAKAGNQYRIANTYLANGNLNMKTILTPIVNRFRNRLYEFCKPLHVRTIILALTCVQFAVVMGGSSNTIAAPQQDLMRVDEPYASSQGSTPSNRRIALVVGINKYKYSNAALRNPLNDARDMERILSEFGFQVDHALDVDYQHMEKAIDKFIAKLGPGTVGLFYYAGHGIQIDGENYLLPVDFVLKDEADAKRTAYSASRLNDRMEGVKTDLNIIILDACRNNPFQGERRLGQGKGLALMNAGKATFIAFATGPNKTADDNPDEKNGLFTKYLLQALKEDPSCLNEVFDRTREKVYLASYRKQIPWAATNVIGRFCFTGAKQGEESKEETCKGKLPSSAESFSIDRNYAPSGTLGDIYDVRIIQTPISSIFEYETTGVGPHEWDYKYIGDKLNPTPAGFAGVFYLDPPNNFGTVCGGFDLRGFRRLIEWEARSLDGEVNVEFIIGGVDWIWDEEKKKVKPRYPDSMPRVSLGTRKLTTKWQSFEFNLLDRPEADFARVVNGFTWVINWNSNGLRFNKDRTGPEQPKSFKIEIRNIYYKR
jgi:hypothetical protein